jgi:hypothetical protein
VPTGFFAGRLVASRGPEAGKLRLAQLEARRLSALPQHREVRRHPLRWLITTAVPGMVFVDGAAASRRASSSSSCPSRLSIAASQMSFEVLAVVVAVVHGWIMMASGAQVNDLGKQ